jgi:uncharacterized protein YhaN
MIDTLKISRRLERANFSEKQAEELADILREAVAGDLVTNDHLDARLAQTDAKLGQMDARFAQMDARIAQMDARMAQMEARLIRWMIGLTLAGVGISVALARAASVIP